MPKNSDRHHFPCRIIGIDPGTRVTGYGVVEKNGQSFKLVTYGVAKAKATIPLEERIYLIYQKISSIIKKTKPQAMSLEDVFYHRYPRVAVSLGMAKGVAIISAREAGLKVYQFKPNEVKSAITGYGLAKKYQVQKMVTRLLNLKEDPEPEDASDALALAICCLSRKI
ncbi:MAG: crossover junction endodeoxyribonuclease RuvC [Candidatus Omnitrophica bacterium]|nr:crossover junction endodeoxyribonuclease RuvC [Candidatus Omnitrophota bacterium]